MDVGFHSNFCFGWERHGLVSGSLLLVIWGGGGALLFYKFFVGWGVGVACFGILRGQILFNFFFFTFFLTNFFTFFCLFILLTPAHKGWGYSRPLRRPGGGGRHKVCGCSTA